MKTFALLAAVICLSPLAIGSALHGRGCHGNNCARAVTGTRPGLPPTSLRKSDCASFLATTVTPAPTTITVTTTVGRGATTAKMKRDPALDIRQVTVVPTSRPSYAANCADAAEYSSACSCWGVTATVSQAPTPTVTETVTVTGDYCAEDEV